MQTKGKKICYWCYSAYSQKSINRYRQGLMFHPQCWLEYKNLKSLKNNQPVNIYGEK